MDNKDIIGVFNETITLTGHDFGEQVVVELRTGGAAKDVTEAKKEDVLAGLQIGCAHTRSAVCPQQGYTGHIWCTLVKDNTVIDNLMGQASNQYLSETMWKMWKKPIRAGF